MRYRSKMRLSLVLPVLLGGACIVDYHDPPIPPPCGNGVLEYPEGCDDGNTQAGDGCSSACEVELTWECAGSPSVCETSCGNGVAEGVEACDGSDLRWADCAAGSGYASGQLACNTDCLSFDDSGCYTCGDGQLQGPEICDATDFVGETCASLSGFESGELYCDNQCSSINLSGCYTCGDGQIHGYEVCDGANLGGADCRDFSEFNSGTLACGTDCQLDTSDCSASCDTVSDCYECSICARETTCEALTTACYANNDCGLILHYIDMCDPPDLACHQQYMDWFPPGVADFNALASCMYCSSCAQDCTTLGWTCP